MIKLSKSAFSIFILALVCSVNTAHAAEKKTIEKKDPVTIAAENGRYLTIEELHRIYYDRTWVWEDGAGYFQGPKRRFLSWVRSGKDASYGDGNWYLTQDGRVCFRATWYAMDGSALANTCFQHKTDGKHNYQRRWPDGDWYVFAHQKRRRTDEINKLKGGDRVTRKVKRNMMYIEKYGVPQDFCSKKDPLVKALCALFCS